MDYTQQPAQLLVRRLKSNEVENFYSKVLEKDSENVVGTLKLANVLNEKGEDQAAIKLIDSLILFDK